MFRPHAAAMEANPALVVRDRPSSRPSGHQTRTPNADQAPIRSTPPGQALTASLPGNDAAIALDQHVHQQAQSPAGSVPDPVVAHASLRSSTPRARRRVAGAAPERIVPPLMARRPSNLASRGRTASQRHHVGYRVKAHSVPQCSRSLATPWRSGRGGGCPPPLPQIRTCGTPASGSSIHGFAGFMVSTLCTTRGGGSG